MMKYATLIALLFVYHPSAAEELEFVPERGGWPMNDVLIGKSSTLDYRGHHYYFFVLDPAIDKYVSNSMLNDGGWENDLNQLLDDLLREEPSSKDMPILDVGANIGAFSLHAASRGCRVFSFEMQPRLYSLLQLSRRMNGYKSLIIHHAALWNETGAPVSFTPEVGNFGGTSLQSGGKERTNEMRTTRIDELLPEGEVFFMKIDVENNEERVLHGMESLLLSQSVRHFVMETRSNQQHMIGWFYRMGYTCGIKYDRTLLGEEAMRQHVAESGLSDIYCTVVKGRARTRRLFGI